MTSDVSWRLKVRRRWRRLPPVRAISVMRQVVAHPSNRGSRFAAVRRSIEWQVASRRNAAPRDIEVYGGLTLRAYPRSNSASNVIYFTPYFDPVEMDFMRRFLKAGDCFVDCGANIGTYSLLAASIVGSGGRVVSYEPVASTARRLRENVEINRLESVIDVRQVAVGAEGGVAMVSSGSDVSNSLVFDSSNSRPTEEIRVVAVTLDDLPAIPALIKIDVEGYEMEALRGMSAILGLPTPPVILIELTPQLLRRAGTSATEVATYLAEAGFSMFVAAEKDTQFMRVGSWHDVEAGQANYLAVPPAHVEAIQPFLVQQGDAG